MLREAVADHSDLAFILDCTGSMQRYINSVRDHIFGICDMIRGEEGLGGPDDLRVAVSHHARYVLYSSLTAGHEMSDGADSRLSIIATTLLKTTHT